MNHIDFSKMSHDEAVGRLEKAQAALYDLAVLQLERLKKVKAGAGVAALASVGFTDGSVHATCIALDFLQGRAPGTNLRNLVGVEEPACTDPLFV